MAKVCKDWEEENFKAKDFNIRTTALRIGIVLDFDGGAMQKNYYLYLNLAWVEILVMATNG
ncbi:MAG: hypothetical protein CM1200mP16_09400 [Nitrospina sp.]|nr:MAG: hypothetical protein CM1200mP16_09400 [Nitrospina sp.]